MEQTLADKLLEDANRIYWNLKNERGAVSPYTPPEAVTIQSDQVLAVIRAIAAHLEARKP